MSPELKSFLTSFVEAVQAQSEALVQAARKIPKLDPDLLARLERGHQELQAMSPGLALKANGHEVRSLELRPYLVEYAGEEARQLSYHDLSELLGLSEASIRVRISQSFHKGFIRTVRGRPVVVLRDPANLSKILNEKFAQTQHPDDQVVLPKRPPKPR